MAKATAAQRHPLRRGRGRGRGSGRSPSASGRGAGKRKYSAVDAELPFSEVDPKRRRDEAPISYDLPAYDAGDQEASRGSTDPLPLGYGPLDRPSKSGRGRGRGTRVDASALPPGIPGYGFRLAEAVGGYDPRHGRYLGPPIGPARMSHGGHYDLPEARPTGAGARMDIPPGRFGPPVGPWEPGYASGSYRAPYDVVPPRPLAAPPPVQTLPPARDTVWVNCSQDTNAIETVRLSPGEFVQVQTYSPVKCDYDGYALLQLGTVYRPDQAGQLLEAKCWGASDELRAQSLQQWFPPGGTAGAILHFCRGPHTACGCSVEGKWVWHVDILRVRSPLSIHEPWVDPRVYAVLGRPPPGFYGPPPYPWGPRPSSAGGPPPALADYPRGSSAGGFPPATTSKAGGPPAFPEGDSLSSDQISQKIQQLRKQMRVRQIEEGKGSVGESLATQAAKRETKSRKDKDKK